MPEVIESDSHVDVSMIQVGDRAYHYRTIKNCKVCRSQYRMDIEKAVLSGLSYRKIYYQVSEGFGDHSALGSPSYQGIISHVRKGHMPMPFSAQRTILEGRADELGRSIEEAEGFIMDSIGTLRAVAQRGFERMNSGEIQPTMTDLIAALRLESALSGSQEGGGTEETWRQAFITYMEVVKANVSAELFQRIGEEMRGSPVMQQILDRQKAIA